MTAHLSKELQQKYGKKRIPLRKGDTVKIMIGQFKKKTGKVTKVNLRKERIYVENVHHAKRDGSKSFYPLHPSNVLITELYTEDKKRIKKWERKNGTHQKTSRAKDMADKEKKN